MITVRCQRGGAINAKRYALGSDVECLPNRSTFNTHGECPLLAHSGLSTSCVYGPSNGCDNASRI